jgi:PPOX class probable F420-dependent enzyme
MLETTLLIDPQTDSQLRSAPIAWIGTVRPDGIPHLVPVWFQWDGESFLFFAQPNDQKIRNLINSADIVLGIPMNPEATNVSIIHGRAELVQPLAPGSLPADYVAKYRDQIDEYGWTEAGLADQYTVPVRVRPTKLVGW